MFAICIALVEQKKFWGDMTRYITMSRFSVLDM